MQLPTTIDRTTTALSILGNVQVVDAASNAVIHAVIAADAVAGKVTRFATDDDGHLVRKDDAFQIVEEDRPIRFEWIAPPTDEPQALANGQEA